MRLAKSLAAGFGGHFTLRLLVATNMLITLTLFSVGTFGSNRLDYLIRQADSDGVFSTCVITLVVLSTLTGTGLLVIQTLHWRTRSSCDPEWHAYVFDAVMVYLWWCAFVTLFPWALMTAVLPYDG